MKKFEVIDLPLSGLKLLSRNEFKDHRGFFSRLFCKDELSKAGWISPLMQVNHSVTQKKGTVRGLHYQYSPHSEMKLITCLRGEIWDVAVDLRQESPTFLQWHAEVLSSNESNSLLIPEGFAHGFQTLTDTVEVVYCSSANYYPEFESGLNVNDPGLGINWPLPILDLSKRDSNLPFVTSEFKGVKL